MIVGLTGNIGSGKSTVSGRLAQLGAEVIDTDLVARDVVAPGTPGLERIVREFGPGIINEKGELDRARMASIVFENPGARARLEAIVHPEVKRVVAERISDYREGRGSAPVLVVEVPLLIESGMHRMMDEIWVVTVDRSAQVERVIARSGLSGEEVEKRINAQMPQEEKCRYAHRVIDNSGTVEQTIRQVDAIWREITATATE
ncbi:MAG: dephospho-CoA kinase [Peptococcaceae bacterium]|nr:dephospho-CoA kinase [Peptococcaceae bacterium]